MRTVGPATRRSERVVCFCRGSERIDYEAVRRRRVSKRIGSFAIIALFCRPCFRIVVVLSVMLSWFKRPRGFVFLCWIIFPVSAWVEGGDAHHGGGNRLVDSQKVEDPPLVGLLVSYSHDQMHVGKKYKRPGGILFALMDRIGVLFGT